MSVPEVSKQTALESTPWKPSHGTLPKIEYVDNVIFYEDFFQNILLKNQLCIIGADATADWTSRKNWVVTDGSPHFDYLLEHFGESLAPVADCNSEEFCAHPKTEMAVKEFLTYWQSYRTHDHNQHKTCLYLKDWHFERDFPDYSQYQTPMLLSSDWMNEFWDVWEDKGKTDDYRFVYMGSTGSWTPLHADVLHSYSWSANICGKKKWIFFPPGEEKCLKDKHGHLVFDLRSAELQDSHKYPHGSSAVSAAITVIQNPGEIIFVPSGWHHQVFNLEDTISINHNWINGCSAHLSWNYLKNRLLAVQKEIDDCKNMEGWHQQCQVLLKADSGINYMDFYTFMACIATHRMIVLDKYILAQSTADPHNVTDSFNGTKLAAKDRQRHHGDRDDDNDTVPVSNMCSVMCEDNETVPVSNVCPVMCEDNDTVPVSNVCPVMCEDDNETVPVSNMCPVMCEGDNETVPVSNMCPVMCEGDNETIPVSNMCSVMCEGDVDRRKSRECCFTLTNGSLNKFSNQPHTKTTCGSRDVHGMCSQLVDNTDNRGKLAPDRRSSESNSNSQICSYLCLFKGTVVNAAQRICNKDVSIQNQSTPSDEDNQDDDDYCNHHHCPHWAHTGPNLALFDLCRVLDIVQDMKDCVEFNIIIEEEDVHERISVPPTALVVQVESTIKQMLKVQSNKC